MFATKTRLFGIFSALVLSFSLIACGDDDDGGSGVDESKQLNELSESEREAVCESIQDQLGSVAADSTKFGCYANLAFMQMCTEATVQTCIDESEPDEPEDCSMTEPETCTATVGELNDCQDAAVSAIRTAASGVTCENVLERIEGLSELPPACQAIEDECPSKEAKLIKSRFRR